MPGWGQGGGIFANPKMPAAARPEDHWLRVPPKAAADVPIARVELVAMPAAAASADHPGNQLAAAAAAAAAGHPGNRLSAAALDEAADYHAPRFPSNLMPAAETQGFVTVMLQRWHKPTSHQRQRASRNRASAAAALTV
jgi:hypothetical protein